MGFRFRRSLKIAPGVRLNFSKSGVSTSLGGRGATVNLSKRGAHGTVGVPGSGLSYSSKLGGGRRAARRASGGEPSADTGLSAGKVLLWIVFAAIVCAILFS